MSDEKQVFGGWHLCDLCGMTVGNGMADRVKHKNVCRGVDLQALAEPVKEQAKEFKFVEMGGRIMDDQLPMGPWSEPDPSWNQGTTAADTYMRRIAAAISDMLGEEVRWVNVPDACYNPLCERGSFSTCGGEKVSPPISIRQIM